MKTYSWTYEPSARRPVMSVLDNVEFLFAGAPTRQYRHQVWLPNMWHVIRGSFICCQLQWLESHQHTFFPVYTQCTVHRWSRKDGISWTLLVGEYSRYDPIQANVRTANWNGWSCVTTYVCTSHSHVWYFKVVSSQHGQNVAIVGVESTSTLMARTVTQLIILNAKSVAVNLRSYNRLRTVYRTVIYSLFDRLQVCTCVQ